MISILLITTIVTIGYFATKQTEKIAQEEITMLLRANGQMLIKEKYRDFTESIGFFENQFFIRISNYVTGRQFFGGNNSLSITGSCVDNSYFEYQIYFCKEKIFPTPIILMIILVLILSMLVAVSVVKKLNRILHRSLTELLFAAGFNISETLGLGERWSTVLEMSDQFLVYKNREIENQKSIALTELAKKVAHDIRSPISTLNLLASRINDPDLKILQLSAVNQINLIANNLLCESKSQQSENQNLNSFDLKDIPNENAQAPNLLKELFTNITKEYDLKKSYINRHIKFDFDDSIFDRSSGFNEKAICILQSAVNNFIQNAIEATLPSLGIITISVYSVGGKVEISVNDNGKGIPKHILPLLGDERISFGKNDIINSKNSHISGNGIALFNAKKDLREIDAELNIYSVENKGTTICIVI